MKQLPSELAERGLAMLKEAILVYLEDHPNGVRHAQIVTDLGLQSAYEGKQKNYLSWSVIGLLIDEKRVRYERKGRSKFYFRA
jgi:hypothetical protein